MYWGCCGQDATGISVNSGTGFFNPLAFVLPAGGQFGNAGRDTIPGPGLVSLNASFGRPFTFGERKSLEFRFDATNVLNQVNITGIGTTVNAANYGLPLTASAMRSMSVTFEVQVLMAFRTQKRDRRGMLLGLPAAGLDQAGSPERDLLN